MSAENENLDRSTNYECTDECVHASKRGYGEYRSRLSLSPALQRTLNRNQSIEPLFTQKNLDHFHRLGRTMETTSVEFLIDFKDNFPAFQG
jgi:hypothetical protein